MGMGMIHAVAADELRDRDGAARPAAAPARKRWGGMSQVVCAGLSCAIGWVTSMLVLGGVVSGAFSGGEMPYNPFFLSATGTVALMAIAYCLPPRAWQRHLGSAGSMAALAAIGALGLAMTAVLGLRLCDSAALHYLFGACVGLAIAVLLVQYLVLLADFDARAIATILLVATIAALMSFVVIHYLRKQLNNSVLTTCASAAMLLASMGCLVRLRGIIHPMETVVDMQDSMLARVTVFAFVTCFASQFLLTFNTGYNSASFFSGPAGAIATGFGSRIMTERIGCILCGVALLGLLMVLWKTSKRPGFVVLTIYRIIVFSLVMSMGFMLAQIAQQTPPYVTYALTLLAFFLSQTGTWLLALHAGYLHDNDPISFIGYTVMAQFLGYFLGFLLCEALEASFLMSPVSAIGALLSLLAIVCVTFLFIFTERNVNRLGRIGFAETRKESTLDGRCEIARERFCLTDRETEVLKLLARGRNAVSIQEMLVLSYNTVKAHKHNIYVKMDVHSQQELLTVIEGL